VPESLQRLQATMESGDVEAVRKILFSVITS
jgi:hypothetical protein